jgi:hypothetical protein
MFHILELLGTNLSPASFRGQPKSFHAKQGQDFKLCYDRFISLLVLVSELLTVSSDEPYVSTREPHTTFTCSKED